MSSCALLDDLLMYRGMYRSWIYQCIDVSGAGCIDVLGAGCITAQVAESKGASHFMNGIQQGYIQITAPSASPLPLMQAQPVL